MDALFDPTGCFCLRKPDRLQYFGNVAWLDLVQKFAPQLWEDVFLQGVDPLLAMLGVLPARKKVSMKCMRGFFEGRDLWFAFDPRLLFQRILALGQFNAHSGRTLAHFRDAYLWVCTKARVSTFARNGADVSQDPLTVALGFGGMQCQASDAPVGNCRVGRSDVPRFDVSDGGHSRSMIWYAT